MWKFFLPFYFCVIISILVSNACSYSVTMTHTEGNAEDVVDQTSTANPNITLDPNITIPGIV